MIMGKIESALQIPKTAEIEDVDNLLDRLSSENLTNWESDFVSNLQDKIVKYKGAATFSDLQLDWLNRLAEKYDLDPA